jgi:rhodanese-related sulfurtransferase
MSSVLETEANTAAAPELRADTRMADVLAAYPGAQRALFARYHIGGCQSCGFQPDETLGEVCSRNEDLPVTEVIEHIVEQHQGDEQILVTPAELKALIDDSDSSPTLLDIRTREEFEAVHLPEAQLFSNELTNEIFGTWDKESTIVVYDHTGTRCLDAATYFIGHGFGNVKALRGGIDAWSQEIDTSVPRYRVEYEED